LAIEYGVSPFAARWAIFWRRSSPSFGRPILTIYARVSTDDKGQDPENQLQELRTWTINSGHAISGEYVDYESGRKGTDRRKQFAALFDDASKRRFDCVLFWALDRFSREGMAQTIIHLQRLSSYDVAFHRMASLR
jgi:DNA invertase Pin-like site-specific DNA recombinase